MNLHKSIATPLNEHRHIPSALVLAATFVSVGIMQWPLIPVLAVLAPLSIALSWPRKSKDA
jgi:chromate transporter